MHCRGPSCILGKTEDEGEESEDTILGKVNKWTLNFYQIFHIMKTEEWRLAEYVKVKCEDFIFKCGDPKLNSGWLDPIAHYI